jgi:hypothetical protein
LRQDKAREKESRINIVQEEKRYSEIKNMVSKMEARKGEGGGDKGEGVEERTQIRRVVNEMNKERRRKRRYVMQKDRRDKEGERKQRRLKENTRR